MDTRLDATEIEERFSKALRGIGVANLLLILAFSCSGFASAAGKPQEQPETQNQPTNLIYSIKGEDLFRAYCASCHGPNGKGGGPVAVALKAKMPDLTLLAKRNDGQFPSARVGKIITGDEVVASHGSLEMPIWGPIFHQIENDQDFGNVRVQNLVKYLESIQSVTFSNPPTGAELYRENCAACHRDDLKGGGAAPFPYRAPPDLTTLARRHSGKFPDVEVSNILRNGVTMPAHGPAEMPIWGADFLIGNKLNKVEVASRISALVNYIESRQVK
jgi:mono/diheme cytochrome c family protein